MYQIRIRTNKRLDEYGHHDRINVGVRLRNGDFTYLKWRGFTLDMDRPVKLLIEAYSLDSDWNPRDLRSKMPTWEILGPGEFLLGSRTGSTVRTLLPFTIVT